MLFYDLYEFFKQKSQSLGCINWDEKTDLSAVIGCVITVGFGIFVSLKYCKYADEKHSDGIMKLFITVRTEFHLQFRRNNGGLSIKKHIMRYLKIRIANNL